MLLVWAAATCLSANLALAATGAAENEGTELESLSGKAVAFRDRLVWGNGTVAVEGVPAVVTAHAVGSAGVAGNSDQRPPASRATSSRGARGNRGRP